MGHKNANINNREKTQITNLITNLVQTLINKHIDDREASNFTSL